MIILTGGLGFIGSCLLQALNDAGINDIILVDNDIIPAKQANISGKRYLQWIHRDNFFDWAATNGDKVTAVIHLGACTDTTETNVALFDRLNLHYSQRIWLFCVAHQIPLIYASSAATYGHGELGYADSHDLISQLRPLNAYGQSKQDFDVWALAQVASPPNWYGLKFFNVYGPNEYHKGRMASVVYHAYQQIRATGRMRLFRSHRSDYRDGEQLRDFVYVKDISKICAFLLAARPKSGIYNLGTGVARSFLDLANTVFATLGMSPDISFIDTPLDIRDKYQYHTEAVMDKLRSVGYAQPFYTLEQGISEYVGDYLLERHR